MTETPCMTRFESILGSLTRVVPNADVPPASALPIVGVPLIVVAVARNGAVGCLWVLRVSTDGRRLRRNSPSQSAR
jgi:hypothetical protein